MSRAVVDVLGEVGGKAMKILKGVDDLGPKCRRYVELFYVRDIIQPTSREVEHCQRHGYGSDVLVRLVL